MLAIRSRASCFSLAKVSSSKAINLRTSGLPSASQTDADSITVRGNRSGNQQRALSLHPKRGYLMTKLSVAASIIAIAILAGPVSSLAQSGGGGGGSAGGAASGPSAGSGSAAGSPNAGSAGARTGGGCGAPP